MSKSLQEVVSSSSYLTVYTHFLVAFFLRSWKFTSQKLYFFLNYNVGSPSGLPLFDHLRSVFLFHLHMLIFDNIVRWRHHLKSFDSSQASAINSVVSFFTQSFVSDRCFIFHPIRDRCFIFHPIVRFPDRCFIFHPKFGGGGEIRTSDLPI